MSHNNERLDIVCLEASCQCVLCYLCFEEEHPQHKILSLQSFIAEVGEEVAGWKEEATNRNKLTYAEAKMLIQHSKVILNNINVNWIHINQIYPYYYIKGIRLEEFLG